MVEKTMLRDFEVVELDRVRGDALMTVTSSCVRFNGATARELGFPEYARALIHEPTKRLAIETCEMNDKSAFAFVRDEAGRNEDVLLKVPALLMTIKKLAGIDEDVDALSFQGVLYPEERVIMFELVRKQAADGREECPAKNNGLKEKVSEATAPETLREMCVTEVTGMPAVQKAHRGRPRKVARPVAINPLHAAQGNAAVFDAATEGGIKDEA
jgi:hypothetical protein